MFETNWNPGMDYRYILFINKMHHWYIEQGQCNRRQQLFRIYPFIGEVKQMDPHGFQSGICRDNTLSCQPDLPHMSSSSKYSDFGWWAQPPRPSLVTASGLHKAGIVLINKTRINKLEGAYHRYYFSNMPMHAIPPVTDLLDIACPSRMEWWQ